MEDKKQGIPKEYSGADMQFVRRLVNSDEQELLDSFQVFPENVNFNGKDETETVILLLRKHWSAFIKRFLWLVLISFLIFLYIPVSSMLGYSYFSSATFILAYFLTFTLLFFTFVVDTFVKWYFSVVIITNEKFVELKYLSLLVYKFSDAQTDKIQDVTHAKAGILSSFFDKGTVFVQTASEVPEFVFKDVPKPMLVQDALIGIVELRKKGEI